MMSEEQWKNVIGYEGIYIISNYGKVKRIIGGQGAVIGRILKHIFTNGYPRVFLSKSSKQKYIPVHRLVLEAFVGLCPLDMECCHNDGDRLNPNLDNLRWDTRSSNQLDSIKHGTKSNGNQRGSQHSQAKLTEADIYKIKHLLKTRVTQKKIAQQFGVRQPLISKIKLQKKWKHIYNE